MSNEGSGPAGAFTRALLEEVGHELRTPLSSILGHQELLSEGILGELTEKATHAVDRIGIAARQLTHLLNGAVDLAGLAAGSPPALEIESSSIAHINAEVRAYAASLGRDGAPLEVVGGTAPALLRTDAKRLERVLVLATTAVVREAPEGRIVLTLPAGVSGNSGDAGGSGDGGGPPASGEARGRATWVGPGGEWLWAPETGDDPAEVLREALGAIPPAGQGHPPGSWLRIAVAAVTAALLGGSLRFHAGAEQSTLEAVMPPYAGEV